MRYEDGKKKVAEAIEDFPETFGLRGRGMPQNSCRISTFGSFYGSDGQVWLVIETEREGRWMDVCRATPAELRREIISERR